MMKDLMGILAMLWVVGASPGLPASAASADHPDFSGVWELDDELSDNPREKMQQAMEQRMRSDNEFPLMGGSGGDMPGGDMGGGGRSEGSGARGGAGGMGGPGGMPDPEGMHRRLREIGERVRVMEIEHDPAGMTVVYADGNERVLHLDGKKHHRETGRGDLETKSKWSGNREISVKVKAEDGRQAVEKWELAAESGLLEVTVAIRGGGSHPGFLLKRVYRRRDIETGADTELDE